MKLYSMGLLEYNFIPGWCSIYCSFYEFSENLLNRISSWAVFLAKSKKLSNIRSSFLLNSLIQTFHRPSRENKLSVNNKSKEVVGVRIWILQNQIKVQVCIYEIEISLNHALSWIVYIEQGPRNEFYLGIHSP